jgi:hypothetical protein
MKQVSKRILAVLLVIYIIVLVIKISSTFYVSYPTAYIIGIDNQDATISLYVNTAPYLVENISDIAWYQTYSYTGLDLDDYFNDTQGNTLEYNFTGPLEVAVSFDEDNVVTFTAVNDTWTGDTNITFNCTDEHGLHVNSNLVNLTVIPYTPSVGSSGGGGGGGGGGGRMSGQCNESWACTDWTECIFRIVDGVEIGTQTRQCIDENQCETELNIPELYQNCDLETAPASEKITFDEAIQPFIKEVSHRPVLWLVFALGAVFSIEAYIFLHKKMRSRGGNYN